ncbi:hypothetical protein VTO58DRAFT_110482 [Aureobasidium pullulans]|nr:hypothetical protein JADG_002766 [Aureobasidium pullulans]
MPSSPPSYRSSDSIPRSETSRKQIRSLADEMLRSSLSRSVSSSASMSRSQARRTDTKLLAEELLQNPPSSSRKVPAISSPHTATAFKNSGIPTSTTSVPPSYAMSERLMKLALKQEVDKANAHAPLRNTTGLFKAACSTDLLFLIDTTCSMDPYLNSAKEQVKSIVKDIKKTFLNESDVRIAVVSYKDHGSAINIEFLDFTRSTDGVFVFLDGLEAEAGGDPPEDVLGGIYQALQASWKQQTRCMVHIADAPPHGRGLHDLKDQDDYYLPGSEPHGLTYKPLLNKLVQLNINYAFLRIKCYTDRMALVFAQVYGHRNAKLHISNTYHSQMVSTASKKAGTSNVTNHNIAPQFEEFQLGLSYSELQHLVVKTVTDSITRTASRLSVTWNATSKIEKGTHATTLDAIHEGGSAGSGSGGDTKNSFEKVQRWTTPGWLDETLDLEGFCPAVVIHDMNTLDSMMAADENIKLSVLELKVRARSKPFDRGAMRNAFYASSTIADTRFVLKSFLRHGEDERAQAAEDMRIQTLCKAFALEFNGLLKIEPPLDFLVTSCLQSKSKTRKKCSSLELLLDGEYVKYNNNTAWVNDELPDDSFNQTAQAFSHFTFERSWGLLLINDLQGVDHILTDPTIQTRDPERFKLHQNNLGVESFKFFFARHECNSVCRELGLLSNRETFASGRSEFRKEWPVMAPTVCCSNKLCRSIVRMTNSHESTKFPGQHWCSTCWKQLMVPAVTWICIEPGPNHEFEVSRFYHESQGQLPPRKCLEHREKDVTESSAATVGGSLWSRMQSAGSKTSLLGKSW